MSLSSCLTIYILCTPSPPTVLLGLGGVGGGIEPPTKFSEREGGACTGKEVSEIFNDQKLYKQKFFSVITNNLNWEIFGCNKYREKGIRFQRDSS